MVDYDYGEAITTDEEYIPKYLEEGYFDFIEAPVPGLEGPEFSQLHRDRRRQFGSYKGYADYRRDRMYQTKGGKISPEYKEELLTRVGGDENELKEILDYHTENIGQTTESEVYPYMQAEYVKGIQSAIGPNIEKMISEGVDPGEIIDYWNKPLYRTPNPGDEYGRTIARLRKHYNRDYDKTLGELPIGTTIEDLKNIDFKDQPWSEYANTFPNFPTLHPGEVSQGEGQDLAGGLESAGYLRGFKEKLDRDLADGEINQQQYDEILSNVTQAGQWALDEYYEARGFTKSNPTVNEEVFKSVKDIDEEPIF